MNSAVFRFALITLAGVMGACANPFADSASTKGPGLNVVSGVGRITVSWNNVLGASGYHLEWSTAASLSGATVRDPASSPVVIENTVPGETYHLRVQANLKSGPSSWSTAALAVPEWTWAPAPQDLGTKGFTDVQTLVVAGSSVEVSTSYTVTTTRHETLKYTAAGLRRSTFLRTTTRLTGATGSQVVDTSPVEVVGTWDPGKLWQSLTLGTSPSVPVTALAEDRSSFTFDGAVWTLLP